MALNTQPAGVAGCYSFRWYVMRSEAKRQAAEQVLGGGVREGLHVFYQGPGDPIEVKIYAPWRSYPPGKRERQREARMREILNSIHLED